MTIKYNYNDKIIIIIIIIIIEGNIKTKTVKWINKWVKFDSLYIGYKLTHNSSKILIDL